MINRVVNFLIHVLSACRSDDAPASASHILAGGTAPALGVSPVDAPEWDADDRGALLAFLRTHTGRTLLLWLRHSEEVLKATACDAAQTRVDHARGRAVGYREAIASLILLSAPEGAATGRGGNDDAPENQVEDFAEPPVRGAAELRNQLSHDS